MRARRTRDSRECARERKRVSDGWVYIREDWPVLKERERGWD